MLAYRPTNTMLTQRINTLRVNGSYNYAESRYYTTPFAYLHFSNSLLRP